MSSGARLPASCGIGFKEWAGVCDALASGRQSLIFRKGGISEGPGGFAPEHEVFWLFPTHLHEATQGLRTEPAIARTAPASGDRVPIRDLAVVRGVWYVDRIEVLQTLEDFHVWTEETVRKRFEYRRPGLWVLSVRIFQRAETVVLAVSPEQAGCKTWVLLEPPLSTEGVFPVLEESVFRERQERLLESLSPQA